jgi:hypothetical protein
VKGFSQMENLSARAKKRKGRLDGKLHVTEWFSDFIFSLSPSHFGLGETHPIWTMKFPALWIPLDKRSQLERRRRDKTRSISESDTSAESETRRPKTERVCDSDQKPWKNSGRIPNCPRKKGVGAANSWRKIYCSGGGNSKQTQLIGNLEFAHFAPCYDAHRKRV